MNSPALVVALIAAILGPLLAYVTASRKLSGRIGTSEASQLWEESSKIRDEYRQRLVGTDKRQAALEARVTTLEALNIELSRENAELRAQVTALERKLASA